MEIGLIVQNAIFYNGDNQRFVMTDYSTVRPAATLKTDLLTDGTMYEVSIRNNMVISVSTYEPPVVDDRIERIIAACEHSMKYGLGHVHAAGILAICKEV